MPQTNFGSKVHEFAIWILVSIGDCYLDLRDRYLMRLKRRRFLFRAIRKRRQLKSVIDRTNQIGPKDILVFSTVRNEIERLPYFLQHYRQLGVSHFFFVVNDDSDGTADFLTAQPDTSVWTTKASYKMSRVGVDWLTWLQIRYGHNHWCLTVDADELLIYSHHETRPIVALTEWLDDQNICSFGALMLDMYPRKALGVESCTRKSNPIDVLAWFDSGNYSLQVQAPKQNLWIQGGPRARHFFNLDPRRAPTLNKIPLVKWNRRYAYVNSTHSALPPHLNITYDRNGGERISGVLLHTKFLDTIVDKSKEELQRGEHFQNSALYDDYYQAILDNPVLWTKNSERFENWDQLERLGLMSSGGWA